MSKQILNRLNEAQQALNRGASEDAMQLLKAAIELVVRANAEADFKAARLVRDIERLMNAEEGDEDLIFQQKQAG